MMKSRRGMITVDFLFAIVLVLGFCSILFALSMTLTVAEVTQYITFASARNYFAAHITYERQTDMALAKYTELVQHPEFAPLFKNGWFSVNPEPYIGDMTKVVPGYQQANESQNMFWGVATPFVARILDFQIPLYGSTHPDGDGTGSGFTTLLGSYLGREVTTQECQQFMQNRWAQIRKLDVTTAAPYSSNTSDQGYNPGDDNGC